MTQIEKLPRGRRFLSQYSRMLRSYEQFKRIENGDWPGHSLQEHHDQMYSFFIECYTLKDWIKKDILNEDLDEPVENFINKNDCLKLCADIANGKKHLELDRPPRYGVDTRLGYEVHLNESDENTTVHTKMYVYSDSRDRFDSFDIATQCVEKWTEFLKRNGLLV
jgi:hypothetical protein